MAAKRGADSQLTKDADSDDDGLSVGSQLGGGQKATAAQMAARRPSPTSFPIPTTLKSLSSPHFSCVTFMEALWEKAITGSQEEWDAYLESEHKMQNIRDNPFYYVPVTPAGPNAIRDRLAKPRGGRRPGAARPSALPAPGMQQQQSYPSPFSQINTNGTSGTQQQQPGFGFGQQTQQLNGTQNQASMSFPPFGNNSNGNISAASSFPQSTSTFNFTNDRAQYITNPFSPTADPPKTRFEGFQGDIFRIYPDSHSKEEKKKRAEEGQQVPQFADSDALTKRQQASADRDQEWFEDGEKAPMFAAHSPFHNNQQGVSNSVQSQPPSNPSATASNSSAQLPSQPTSDVFAHLQQPRHQVPPYNPFGCDMTLHQRLQSSQPMANSVYGTLPSERQNPNNLFGQVPTSTTQDQSKQSEIAQARANIFGTSAPSQSSSVFAMNGAGSTPQPQQTGDSTSQAQGQAPSSTPFGQAPSDSEQTQASHTPQIGVATPQVQNQMPRTPFGHNSSIFQQPQPAQTKSNLFAHIGTPQTSSNIFGQGAAPTPQAQESEKTASPTDQTMMSGSPDSSTQSRPFGFLGPSNTQQSSAPGGSLFERISKPAEPSTETATPAKGGSLFERISKPEEPSTETATPGKGRSLFDRVSKPDTNTATPDSPKPADDNLSDLEKPETPRRFASLFPITNANRARLELSHRKEQERKERARIQKTQAQPSLLAPTQTSSPQKPQVPSSLFAPAQNSSLTTFTGEMPSNGQIISQQPDASPATQKTNNVFQTSSRSQRICGVCPSAPAEFTENEKRDLTTGWRLKALEVGMRYHIRKNPGNVERIKKFYMHNKKMILDANGGPLQISNAEGKRKMGVAEEAADGKKARVNPRQPLEGPNPGQRRKSADADDEISGKKAKMNTLRQPLHGPDPGQKRKPSDAEEETNGETTNGKKMRSDTFEKPAVTRPDLGSKRKSTDDEDDGTDTGGKRARLDTPSRVTSSSHKVIQGKKSRLETNGGAAPSSQTASIFQNIMGSKDDNSNILGHLSRQEDKDSSSNIFGHLSRQENEDEDEDEDEEEDQEHDDETPVRDHTWKPESPITFGSTSPSPKPVFGGLFGSSTPIAKSASANLGFAFTPTNALSQTLAPTPNTESIAFSHAASSSVGNGESVKESKSTFETPSKPAINFFSPSPAKPASNFFSPTPAKSAGVNMGFTPANAASKSLAPPSITDSATTSRATSPGATTGESANESNADEEDHMPKENQVNLTAGGPGEEDEDVLFEVKVKAMVFDPKNKTWPIKGLGPFRILKHKESGMTRMLMRQEPSGKILLNSGLAKQLKYDSSSEKTVRIPIVNAEGKLETWMIKTGLDDAAKTIASLLQEHKSK